MSSIPCYERARQQILQMKEDEIAEISDRSLAFSLCLLRNTSLDWDEQREIAYDLVNEAFTKIIEGRRTWWQVTEEDLKEENFKESLCAFVFSVVESGFKNLMGSAHHRNMMIAERFDQDGVLFDGGYEQLYGDLSTDSMSEFNSLLAFCKSLVADDLELVAIVETILTRRVNKPSELAEELGWEIERVRNALKRFRRRFRGGE